MGPWSFLAHKDVQAGNPNSTITTFFAQLAYVVMVGASIIFGFGLPVIDLVLLFAAVMLVSVIVQTGIALASAHEWQNGRAARYY